MQKNDEERPAGRRHLDFETVGSLVAIIVAIAALWVSWQETSNTRKERLASALPILESGVGLFADDELVLRARVENAGVGTALVYSARLLANGEPIENAQALASRVFDGRLDIGEAAVTIDGIEVTPMPAGKVIFPLELRWSDGEFEGDLIDTILPVFYEQRIALELCYCDIYDRCWRTVRRGFPETVERCPARSGFPGAVLTAD